MKRKDVVIISAEQYYISSGPIYVASLLIKNGYNAFPIQSLDSFGKKEIYALVDKFIVDDKQILAVSITFMRSNPAKVAIAHFIARARSKFPNLRIVIGGTVDYDFKKFFPDDINVYHLMGQNRENEIVDLFNRITGKIKKIPFNFAEHAFKYSEVFFEFKNPPKGIIYYLDLSRNCIFNCSYCAFAFRKQKGQFKSADLIVEELEDFYKTFKTPQIHLLCNTFNDNPDKIRELIKAVNRLSFKPEFFAFLRADLLMNHDDDIKDFIRDYVKFAFFGVETLNKESSLAVQKTGNIEKLKKALIEFRKQTNAYIVIAMIVGLPHSNFEECTAARDFLIDSDVADLVLFSPLHITYLEGKDGSNEKSDIDLYPSKFGYTVEEGSKNIDFDHLASYGLGATVFLCDNWVRDDGYTFSQAVIDCHLLSNYSTGIFRLDAMLFSARGEDLKKLRTIRKKWSVNNNKISVVKNLLVNNNEETERYVDYLDSQRIAFITEYYTNLINM